MDFRTILVKSPSDVLKTDSLGHSKIFLTNTKSVFSKCVLALLSTKIVFTPKSYRGLCVATLQPIAFLVTNVNKLYPRKITSKQTRVTLGSFTDHENES